MNANDEPTPTDLIPLGRAATILTLGPRTVYRWIAEGRLPAWKIGGRVRVSEAVVRGMIRRREVPKRPERCESKPLKRAIDKEADAILRRHGLGKYLPVE